MAKTPRPSTEQTYLERLTFDPRLLTGAVAKYVGNMRLVMLLILAITLLGLVSFFNLPKRLNPEVKIPIVSVVTVLPGASPEDVESLVTIPLENELRNVKGLDTITSVSNENVSVITLQFGSSVEPQQAQNDAQLKVDSVTSLPEDARTPSVQALDFEDQPIWSFVITATGDPRTLMSFSADLKAKIESLSRVDRVETTGFETQEIVVALRPDKLTQYGMNPVVLSQAIQKSVSSLPAGPVMTGTNTFALTIAPSIQNPEDIRSLRLSIQGEVVSLGDIATVSYQPKANQQVALLARKDEEPRRAVTFYVYKTSASAIDAAGKQVEEEVRRVMQEAGDRYTLTSLSNTSDEIAEQFDDLLGEFRATILLVFGCLLVFLGLRQALISSLTVPLTFLSAFALMNMFGVSINFISLFAFLLALGLLVDDTIVVVSAMTNYYKTGKFTPLQTGLLVWRDTIVPIWSTTITTIWSFIPLLLTSGIIGEFIKPIPQVVTMTMVSSTAIAVGITLPIMIVILKPSIPARVIMLAKILGVGISLWLLVSFLGGNPLLPVIAGVYLLLLGVFSLTAKPMLQRISQWFATNQRGKQVAATLGRISDHGIIDLTGFERWYHNTILSVIRSQSARRRVIAASIIYAVVSFALLPAGLVKNEFFPKVDAEMVYVNLELPSGTNLATTQAAMQGVLATLTDVADVDVVIAEAGRQISVEGRGTAAANGALFTLHLPAKEDRNRTSFAIAEEIRTIFSSYQRGKISVIEQSGGPPAGADVQLAVMGPELGELDAIAENLLTFVQEQPGVVNAGKSITTGTPQLVFIPDTAKLAQTGITQDTIGLMLRTYASGFTLDSIAFDAASDEETDIVLKMQTGNADPAGLGSLQVSAPNGATYPLSALGTLRTQANPTTITREDGQRTISVFAGTAPGYSSTEVNQKLLAYAQSLQLPAGYSLKTGGVNEENQKSITSLLQAMVISVILIMITMVLQFNSFRQAFIVLIVIPLAVSSVFLIFALTGTPLSFPGLIGVLSLFGIVVTNSMFIVDKININQKEGMPFEEAIADAGASRLEPILLTKLGTVLGLLPITLADPLWRGLGGAIISGLLIASTIMLLFIPALYYTIFAPKK